MRVGEQSSAVAPSNSGVTYSSISRITISASLSIRTPNAKNRIRKGTEFFQLAAEVEYIGCYGLVHSSRHARNSAKCLIGERLNMRKSEWQPLGGHDQTTSSQMY